MVKTNVMETIRNQSVKTEKVVPQSFIFDDDEKTETDKKLELLEENMKKLERLEKTESELDNQLIDTQQDDTDIDVDDLTDNAKEIQEERQELDTIKQTEESSLFFDTKADELAAKEKKDDVDLEIEERMNRLARLKKKKQVLDLDREIKETEKQAETPGFFSSVFSKKTEEELLRQKSDLDRQLQLAELQSEIQKKKQLIKDTKGTSSARTVLSSIKNEFWSPIEKESVKKSTKKEKKSALSEGLNDFLFG